MGAERLETSKQEASSEQGSARGDVCAVAKFHIAATSGERARAG